MLFVFGNATDARSASWISEPAATVSSLQMDPQSGAGVSLDGGRFLVVSRCGGNLGLSRLCAVVFGQDGLYERGSSIAIPPDEFSTIGIWSSVALPGQSTRFAIYCKAATVCVFDVGSDGGFALPMRKVTTDVQFGIKELAFLPNGLVAALGLCGGRTCISFEQDVSAQRLVTLPTAAVSLVESGVLSPFVFQVDGAILALTTCPAGGLCLVRFSTLGEEVQSWPLRAGTYSMSSVRGIGIFGGTLMLAGACDTQFGPACSAKFTLTRGFEVLWVSSNTFEGVGPSVWLTADLVAKVAPCGNGRTCLTRRTGAGVELQSKEVVIESPNLESLGEGRVLLSGRCDASDCLEVYDQTGLGQGLSLYSRLTFVKRTPTVGDPARALLGTCYSPSTSAYAPCTFRLSTQKTEFARGSLATGTEARTYAFGAQDSIFSVATCSDGTAFCIRRRLVDGRLAWESKLGPLEEFSYTDIAVAPDGASTAVHGCSGTNCVYRISSSGSRLWSRRMVFSDFPGLSSGPDTFERLASDSAGAVIVLGTCTGGYCLGKIDASGTSVWGARLPLTGPATRTTVMRIASNGDIVVGMNCESSSATADVCVIRLSGSGTELWRRQIIGPGLNQFEGIVDLQLDSAGQIYVGFRCNESLSTRFGQSACIAKLAANGSVLWTTKLSAQLTATTSLLGIVVSDSGRTVFWASQIETGGVDANSAETLFTRNLTVNLGASFVNNPTRAVGIAPALRDGYAVYAQCQSVVSDAETRLCISLFDSRGALLKRTFYNASWQPAVRRDPTIWRGRDGFFIAAYGDPTFSGSSGSFEVKAEDASGAFPRSISSRSSMDLSGQGVSAILATVGPTKQLQIGWYRAGKFSFAAIDAAFGTSTVEAVADLDGNGISDLVLRVPGPSGIDDIRVWPDAGSSNSYLLRTVKKEWLVQATGDMDGDGWGDLVWRYTLPGTIDSGASFVWYQDKGRYQLAKRRGGAPLDWEILGAADITADGADDLLYLSPSGQLRALIAMPERKCLNIGAGELGSGEAPLFFADFFNTGKSALLSVRASTGQVKLYSFDASSLGLSVPSGPELDYAPCTRGEQSVVPQVTTLGNVGAGWVPLALGDFTGDGNMDIVWMAPDRRLVLWKLSSPTQVEINADAGALTAGLNVIPTN